MEKYASLIGVDPDMLFYLAVAGIAVMVACLFGMYAIAMGVCFFIVSDFPTFSRKWLDKAIGVLMMILILSEYVVGATAMYQICYCIDHDSIDVSFFLAIITLLGLAFGTILYGVLIIKNNEDELRDLGTKDHFDKKFHARYGPLYDEHSFEGRFFFAPKLLLALLCGMTTGMVWIEGLWQIIVLIAFHIAFLLYLEIKQPYPTAFVQKTSSFVIIIKISALFLSFFLLSSATSFTESIPDDLREGVAFAIVGLQVLVLVCLMIRQVYIFYRTWKLKRDGADDKTVTVQTTNAREGSEAFFALGGEPQYYSNNNQSRGGSLAVLGDDSTPKMQDPRQYAQETPSNVYGYGNRPLRGLQPQNNNYGMQRTHTVVQHDNHHRNNEVDL
ncbi:Carbohydrate-binding protein [Phytophthora palmivora]|uniref:Carbohydrate-binding protein n=1 Tax=Phytophthora palmivora TaxID=4796 RepID=A0A2P4YCK6_9STRA|nr:Carbohydrate-binding protein [Phytophthora palmivora]